MKTWEMTFALAPESPVPLSSQIARAVAHDIQRARLRPGQRLPGSRPLSKTLGVHRNTVLAAWDELLAEGWITTRPAGGTFVSDALPIQRPRRFAPPTDAGESRLEAGYDLRAPPPYLHHASRPRNTLGLSDAQPDLRFVPVDEIARAWRRALRSSARRVLAYGDPRGEVSLRKAVAAMVSEARGVPAREDRVLLTRGSQMALDLIAHALFDEGDVVAVEAIGYAPAWSAFRRAGARVVPLPVDGEGLDVGALDALVAREAVRAVYVTPHHHYPTTVTLSSARRLRLLDLARRHRVAVIEDDYDHEFHYEGRPVLPLASADPHGVVLYLGTLSKVLAPGLRAGYVVAPSRVIERLAAERVISDRQGDRVTEAALAELLDDGLVQRHVRRMRRVYAARRDACGELLRARLGDRVTFRVPAGGVALWCEMTDGTDVDAWATRALERGVSFRTGRHYRFDGSASPHLRVAYGHLDESELADALDRVVRAL